MSYDDLGTFGLLRKIQNSGPVTMFYYRKSTGDLDLIWPR